MKRKQTRRLGLLEALCAVGFLLPLAAPVLAVPIPFEFTATITPGGFDDPDGLLAGSGLGPGGTFSVTYSVESTALDAQPADPTAGSYDGSLLSATLQLGSMVMILDPSSATTNRMWIVDQFDFGGTPVDGYAPVIIGANGSLDGSPLVSGMMQAYLGSSDTTIFASDALPPSQPTNPAIDFDQINTVSVAGSVGGSSFSLDAAVTTTAPTPEPSTGTLLALGLVVLAAGRRPRR